jgi:thymidylate kinase
MKRGRYTWLEGLDGIGKGTQQRVIIESETEKEKTRILPQDFNGFLKDFQKEFKENNNLKNAKSGTLILETSEPTYFSIGKTIREEIIAKNERDYSSQIQIQAYSLDRLVHMRRVVIPFLENGQDVLQSRSVPSTLCYQILKGIKEGKSEKEVREKILEHEGNRLALEYHPDLVIISTIKDVAELEKRLKNRREKDDNCEFENLQFQIGLKPFYESSELKDFLESYGMKVVYLDAGVSIEETKRQAIEIYSDFYDKGIIKEKYQRLVNSN